MWHTVCKRFPNKTLLCVFPYTTGFKSDINQEPECCDVRWDQKSNNRSRGTLKRTHPSCQHTSVTFSGAPRLGQGRLKLCLLVLVLLHTVATMTANQNSTCLTAIFPLDDNAPREEWLDDAGLGNSSVSVCSSTSRFGLVSKEAPHSERSWVYWL